jgi:hypothetical protein
MRTPFILCCFSLCLLTACHSRGSLEKVWAEANEVTVECFSMKGEIDTVFINKALSERICPDSATSKRLDLVRLDGTTCLYQLTWLDENSHFLPVSLWKNGEKITWMVCHQGKLDSLQVNRKPRTKGFLNNRLLFDCSGRPTELYVLWQNVLLPRTYLVFTNEGFATMIPQQAKSMINSQLRIFAVTDSVVLLDARVNLHFGIPES